MSFSNMCGILIMLDMNWHTYWMYFIVYDCCFP